MIIMTVEYDIRRHGYFIGTPRTFGFIGAESIEERPWRGTEMVNCIVQQEKAKG